MPPTAPFRAILEALLDQEHPFPARYLHRFSDLPPQELDSLMKFWPDIPAMRKHSLLEDLEDLEESDTLTCFDDLARELISDSDPQVRSSAIRLLWESEDVKLIPVYLNMLEEDEDVGTRATAANALGQFVYLGELEKIPAATKKTIEDKLLTATKKAKDPFIRRRALESLGYSGRKEVVPLIEAAYQEKDPDWRASALFAMGRSCDERWKKQVLPQLHAPDETVRSEAIRAAGELELGSARTALLDLLADVEDLEGRREIIWALAKIGGEGVRTRLEELLEMEEDDEEAEFIEETLEILNFTEEMGPFDLLDIDPDGDFIEEEPDHEE